MILCNILGHWILSKAIQESHGVNLKSLKYLNDINVLLQHG
jgi:hypothetical protein